jgi:hypothetical protein
VFCSLTVLVAEHGLESETRRIFTMMNLNMRRIGSGITRLLSSAACLTLLSLPAAAQTNIVSNGSFENSWWGWDFPIGGFAQGAWAAQGTNYIQPSLYVSQNLTTVPGRDYIVTFATGYGSSFRVRWGISNSVDVATVSGSSPWTFTNVTFTASSSITSLKFEVTSSEFKLDAVSVGWLEEQPSIITPVASRSTFEGAKASFAIEATGGPPLRYQWYNNHGPLAGATNRVLFLTDVAKADAGEYWVTITNGFGSITSLKAQLLVNALPTVPLIVSQPKPQSVVAGYSANLHSVAFGTAPLSYQWHLNGADIIGATNASYIIVAADPTNAGDYTVTVSNRQGTSLSTTANLQVITGQPGGGSVMLANRLPPTVNSPITEVDGLAKLSGSNYVAQLYAGATPSNFTPLGIPTYFRTGNAAGYFYPETLVLPNVPSGQTCYVQVRVWDRTTGASFEEAKARGERCGLSYYMPVVAGYDYDVPATIYFQSFSLQAGASPLATAKIERGPDSPDGRHTWQLIGDPGNLYLVEHRSPPNNWSPLVTLTNQTGVVQFSDPDEQSASLKFYRARIIEP